MSERYLVTVDGEPKSSPFAHRYFAEISATALTAELGIDPSRVRVKTMPSEPEPKP
jgi:hypothetical protein